ncbi:MAG: YabP/YqfC family sporulation protein [Bacillota bacterium]
MEKSNNIPHTMAYANNKLELTGVQEVVSFEDKEVVLVLYKGGLKVLGHNLIVSQLDTATGKITIVGDVNGIIYTNQTAKVPLAKRLFK